MPYTPGWITVPGKGKRWRTSDGEYLMQRPAGGMPGVLQAVTGAWSKADQVLNGWLPGGGVASPVTRSIFPAQPFPGRSRELEKMTGVRARFVDPAKTSTLVRRVAPLVSPQWGNQDYANPLLGEIGMAEYSGGRDARERRTEIHELGHINPADKGVYSYAGVLGRSLEGVSQAIGNLPVADIAAGLAMRELDAREEDRAERFAARYAQQAGYRAPEIAPAGSSAYGDQLRRQGNELIDRGVTGLTDPFGLVSKVRSGLNELQAAPLRDEARRMEPELKRLLLRDGEALSPELLELNKRHTEITNRIRSLGLDPDAPAR